MMLHSPTFSSDHSHPSTASPGSSHRSPSLSPAPNGSDELKKPKKRKGKVVSVLRQKYAYDADDDDEQPLVPMQAKQAISPLSTTSLMSSTMMRFALNHHLISLAWESIDHLNFPLWIDLSSALDNLRSSLARGSSSITTEVQVAALVCLAARKSNHSALTGISEAETSADQAQVVPVSLGRRREQACVALLERAIAMCDESGAFKLATKDSIQTLSLLRMAVMTCSPRHQVMIDIVSSLKGYYLAGVGSDPADSVIASDAGSALIFGRPLSLTETDMNAFGWPTLDVPALQRTLNSLSFGTRFDERTMLQLRAYVVFIMRKLASCMNRGWDTDSPDPLPVPARAIFDDLVSHAGHMEKAILTLQKLPNVSDSAVFTKIQTNNQLFKLPIFFHSALIKLARKLVAADVDDEADILLEEAQVRYLVWMRTFVRGLSWDPSIDVLSQALIVDGLEALQGWLALAIDGARQSAAGEGPLAQAGFAWDDLRQLHELLKISSSVFASSDVHEQELARQLEMLDLAGGAGAVKAREDAVAEKMLQSALDEMLAE